MALHVVATIVCTTGRPLHAQTAADSAQQARDAWRAAVVASREGDTTSTLRHLTSAHRRWPTQGAYIRALAALSARTGDAAAAARWLDLYAELGFGEDVTGDSAFAAVRDAGPVRRAARRLATNLQRAGRSDVAFQLSDSTVFAEGLACTADGASCFLTDLRNRRVLHLSRDRPPIPFVGPEQGLLAPLAVALDEPRGVLWIASVPLPVMAAVDSAAGGQATVIAFERRSGRVTRRIHFPADGAPHEPGAILVSADGAVYISDSRSPQLFRVPPLGDTLETVAASPLFRSLQGITETGDGRRLYVADYSHGILVVDPHTGAVQRLSVPAGATVLGIDGLAFRGGALIGVQNGMRPARIVRLPLDDSGLRITAVEVLDRRPDIATEPTAGVVVGKRFLYVANSHWPWYDAEGRLRPDARRVPPTVLAVPLDDPR